MTTRMSSASHRCSEQRAGAGAARGRGRRHARRPVQRRAGAAADMRRVVAAEEGGIRLSRGEGAPRGRREPAQEVSARRMAA